MANIFYAWEFGANLGHIGTFLPIARQLREQHHTVHWAVTHTHQAARLLHGENFDWLQAPVMPEQQRENPPLNYADILMRFGYAQPLDLLGLVIAWRKLLQMAGASIVMADHAPSAILAARTLGIPVMLFGNSFFAPPLVHPTPNMRPWLAILPEQLLQIDMQVLASINAVLQHFGQPSLGRVAELFQVEEQALLTFPELDHYENRGDATYWGTLPAAVAAPPSWPPTSGPKVYAYLRPESAHFEAGLQALLQLSASVLVFAPGIPTHLTQRYAAPHLVFASEPVDLTRVAAEAAAGMTYASPAATIAFLMAGKPVVMLPGHLEQFLLARRVVQLGAGLLVDPEKPATELPAMLQRILADPIFTAHAQAFARKYAAFPQDTVVANMVRRIEEISA